ncbi:MAG: hypothetical protein J6586_02740 [Snodgrassella sp.]|nr:hypothetical protein [Snodgrassella sp.]MCO6515431.1 hypothetical protein [Snodgrassella sp.]
MHIPASEIDDWPVSEFNRYLNYYHRFGFPQWRTEQYLAYNTLITARAAGNEELQLHDLLLPDLADDEIECQNVADDDADEIDAFLDGLDD